MKPAVGVLAHTNKLAREEGKTLINPLRRWLGDALRPSLSDVKPVLLSELEAEWAKEDGGRPKPTHTLRSKAAASAAAAAVTKSADGGVAGTEADSADDDDGDEAGAVDAYELADAVNGLSKVPKSFASDLEASKWSVRRDALQAAHNALSAVKLADGDYGDIVRLLQRVCGMQSSGF